tara:strand:- start:396 stop:650 length:255 start_codon:yes stop_codon:yes gene_type:complete
MGKRPKQIKLVNSMKALKMTGYCKVDSLYHKYKLGLLTRYVAKESGGRGAKKYYWSVKEINKLLEDYSDYGRELIDAERTQKRS